MTMLLKRTLLAGAAMAPALLLAGAASAADVTLLFWPGPESEAMQKVIDAYNAGQGQADDVQVEQILFSRQGYFEKELADLAAGSTEFDVALVTTYTLGRYAPYLAPIEQYVTSEVAAGFAPVALGSLSADGHLYGVPTDLSLHMLYYRKDLVDQLLSDTAWQQRYTEIAQEHLGEALTPKAPDDWTWDDYVAATLFFSQSQNPDSPTRYGTVLELKNIIFNIMIWQATLVSNGGDWLDAEGNVTIDSDAARAGLAVYKTIIDNEATPPGSINYEYAEANAAFGSGQAATMLQWNAAFNELNNPETYPDVAGNVGLAPMPAGPEGHKTHVHSLGIGLNAASENKEAAGKFLAWLASEEAMRIYGEAGGTPPFPAVLEELAGQRPEFPLVGQYAADYGFVVTGGTAAYAVPVYEVLSEAFSGYWAGQGDVDSALAAAAAGIAERVAE